MLLTIGQFAERTRLSPKALRIYDSLGLVVPSQVDTTSGYRLYDESQVEHARLVGMLRRVDMPLSTIADLVAQEGPTAATVLAEWWDRFQVRVAERRALVAYLQEYLRGEVPPVKDIGLRALPEREVVYINRHVAIDETEAFFAGAFPRLRAVGLPLEGIAGSPFVVYYREVSEDSDGPVELCRPVKLEKANKVEDLAAGLGLRVEASHEEAYVRLNRTEMSWPAMLPFCDALEQWAREHQRQPLGPLRQVLISDLRTAEPGTPACDLSLPLRWLHHVEGQGNRAGP